MHGRSGPSSTATTRTCSSAPARVRLDAATGELGTSEVAAFITPQALITVRKDEGIDVDAVVERWDDIPDLAGHGVGYLL